MRSRIVPALLITVALAGLLAGLAVYFRGGFGSSTDFIDNSASELTSDSSEPQEAASDAPVDSDPNPDLSVDEHGLSRSVAVIRTKKGDIKLRFYTEDAPRTVRRIVELIQEKFYNGLTFHRVVPNFVIQGGDPQGNGTGGSGKRLQAEFNKRQHLPGTVAMARAADPDSADSQFYVTLSPQPHLDQQYTVFGQVVDGMDIVRSIRPGDVMTFVYMEKPKEVEEAVADEGPVEEPSQEDPLKKAPASEGNQSKPGSASK